MKRTLALLVGVLLLSVLLCPAAQARENIKQQVQNLLNQAAQAMAKKDVEGVAATALPEATIRYLDGRAVGMAQWKGEVARELAQRPKMLVRFEVQKAEAKGDGAVAVYEEAYQYNLQSEPKANYISKGQWRVTLKKTPKGWRFNEFQQLSLAVTKDGKPYKPAGAPGGPAGRPGQ